jgi:hypothetical protein
MIKYIGNIARAPDEDKFRSINMGNAAFHARVASVPGAVDFFKLLGFQVGAGRRELLPLGCESVARGEMLEAALCVAYRRWLFVWYLRIGGQYVSHPIATTQTLLHRVIVCCCCVTVYCCLCAG